MKFQHLNSLLLFFFLLSANVVCGQEVVEWEEGMQSPEAKINDLSWLSGYWKGNRNGLYMDELWTMPEGNNMTGSFRMIKDGEILFSEIESITEENGSLVMKIKHFDKSLKGWEEKDEMETFKLIKIYDNEVWFDRLTIKRKGKNLKIWVLSKDTGGHRKIMHFSFKRAKL